MIKEIFFVRHGLTNNEQKLNSNGIEFSKKLPEIFKNRKIDFILCDDVVRCKDTIRDLTINGKYKAEFRPRGYFSLMTTLQEFSDYESILICYGYVSIGFIQKELDVDILNEKNRDEGYEYIFHYIFENDKWQLIERIPTGYKKQ